MRAWPVAIVAALFLNLCSCASHIGTSAVKTEQSIAASCRAWEERAKKAAHPDAEMIAQHNQLLAKAAKFSDEAQAHYNDVAVRQAAIENEAQAQIEADAIYDWKHDLKVAADCWNDLKVAQDVHQQQREELAALAASLATEPPPPPSTYSPPHSVYTLHTQPPPPPSAMPIPDLGSVYMPPPSSLPNSPALPGPYLGHVPGGPDVYGVPADASPPRDLQ
jgi:hypothetical protein